MPGKPITLREGEYQVLNQAKTGYQQATGKEVDWGEFLLFLLGLWILNELTRKKAKSKVVAPQC